MKKRVFSFVIMVVTLVAIIAFGVPNIINNGKTGMEFNGGFDVLYEVNSESNELSTSELTSAVAKGIEKRLEIASIIDPVVSVEGNKYIRVTVKASDQLTSDEIRFIVDNNAEISFRDFENNLLATGEQLLSDVGASLSDQTDSSGNSVILLHIKDTELLGDITETVSGLSDTHLVVWIGFEEGDDYANLQTNATVAKKIIYNATVSSRLEEDTITVTGSFSKSVAESTVDLINSETLGYTLDVVQISTIQADYANAAFDKVLIASLVALILVIIALSAYYKVGGVVASLSLIFNTFLSLTLFVTFKGLIDQQMIAALIVSLGISVDAIVIILERVKNELYNGKTLEKALNEGYRKSVTSIVDANIVVLIISIIMFFFGSSVSSFALMLSLSSVSSLFVMTLLNKLLLTFAVKLNIKPTNFGARKAYLENKEVYNNRKMSKVNPLKSTKKSLLYTGIFSSIAIVVMLILQLTMGSLFNYNNTINKNSNVTIISTNNYFTDEAHVMQFFAQEGLNIELTNIEMTSFEKDSTIKYRVDVSTKDSISNVEGELISKVIDAFGENTVIEENYELYITDINLKSTAISLLNALYTVSIGLLIAGVYLAFRYRYSYAIAAIVSTLASFVLTALFLGLTRIKVGSDAVIAIFAITVYSLNTLIIMFDRLKELIVDKNKKYISNAERYEAASKAINVTLPRTILTTIAVTIISITLLAFASLTNYSFYITLIIGLLFASASAIIIAIQVWLLFEKRSDKRKREFKAKKKSTKFQELEEQTIIGINDYK